MRLRNQILMTAVILLAAGLSATAAETDELLRDIKSVGREGQGNRAAQRALKQLTADDSVKLTTVLSAFDGANPLAVNWLRGAFETLADRRLKTTKTLPAAELEKFVLDSKQDAGARRLAFEWLSKVDDTAADRLIPGMLNDKSVEFRRDAVARLLTEAEELLKADQQKQAEEIYQKALIGARDDDQIKIIVAELKKLGRTVDLPKHFGFLLSWQLVGPFDNTNESGFDVSYPPEQQVDPSAKYRGKEDKEIGWTHHDTADDYGIVDLAKTLAPHKGAITYAYTEFTSDADREVQFRLGTPNAWKIWLNGELIFARDEYHRGMRLDQYQVPAKLKQGQNRILIKVCQNEQKPSWAQRWQFQIRVCDTVGTAVLSTTRPPRVLPEKTDETSDSDSKEKS